MDMSSGVLRCSRLHQKQLLKSHLLCVRFVMLLLYASERTLDAAEGTGRLLIGTCHNRAAD